MKDDVYLKAYRSGGVDAVNDLLRKQYPSADDRLRVLEIFDDTGLWSVAWQPEGSESIEVKAYLGDD